MSPPGNLHSRDHFIVLVAIALYASLRAIALDGHDNCTYRKAGKAEAQPDASFYIGETAVVVPWDAKIKENRRTKNEERSENRKNLCG